MKPDARRTGRFRGVYILWSTETTTATFRRRRHCLPTPPHRDGGRTVRPILLWNIAREYGWDYTIPKPNFGTAVLTATLHEGAPAAVAAARRALQQPSIALEHGPNFALNAALGLINAHRWDDALALLNYQLEMTPNNADAYSARGYVYQQTGKRDDAVKAVKRALELNPTNENAKSLLKELESSGH